MSGAQSTDLSGLNGQDGFVIANFSIFPRAVGSVSVTGDINKDGIADLIIGREESYYPSYIGA